jgi:hypothetical protein
MLDPAIHVVALIVNACFFQNRNFVTKIFVMLDKSFQLARLNS